MPPLHDLFCSTAGSGVDFIGRLLSRVCRPPVPPRNWNVVRGWSGASGFSSSPLPRISLERNEEQRHVDEQESAHFILQTRGINGWHVLCWFFTASTYVDVQGYLQLPKGLSYFDASSYDSIQSSVNDSESTLCARDTDFLEFSIYSVISSIPPSTLLSSLMHIQ